MNLYIVQATSEIDFLVKLLSTEKSEHEILSWSYSVSEDLNSLGLKNETIEKYINEKTYHKISEEAWKFANKWPDLLDKENFAKSKIEISDIDFHWNMYLFTIVIEFIRIINSILEQKKNVYQNIYISNGCIINDSVNCNWANELSIKVRYFILKDIVRGKKINVQSIESKIPRLQYSLLRLKKNLNKYIKFIFYKLSILVGKFLLNIHNYIINFDIESCKCIIGGWWVYDKTSIGHYNSYILLINNTEYFKDNSIRNLFGYYKRLLSGKIDKKVFFYNCNTFSYGKNKVVFSLIEDLYFEKINLKLFFENYVKEYSKYNYKKVHSNVSNITSFVKNLNPLIKYYTHRTSSDENRILAKLFNLNNFPVIEYAHGICSNPYYWFPKRTNLLYVNNLLDYLHITNSSMGSLTTKISHFNGTKARIIKSKKYDLIYMICRHNGCFYGRNGDINKIDFHIYQKLKDVIKICNNSNLSLLIKLSPGHYPVQKIEISNILKKFCNYPYDLIQTEIDAPDCISMSRIGLTYNSGSAFDIMAQDIPCLVTNSCYDYFISVDLHKLPVLEDFDDLQNHIGMLLTDCEFYKSELIKQKKYYDVITNAI